VTIYTKKQDKLVVFNHRNR